LVAKGGEGLDGGEAVAGFGEFTGVLRNFGQQFGGEFHLEAVVLGQLLIVEVVLVGALLPTGEVLFAEIFAVLAESLDDFFVRQAFVEHVMEGGADGAGETGDFVGATASALGPEAEDFRNEVWGFGRGVVGCGKRVHNMIF